MEPIDLRSDTVTSPSPAMRQAMAAAPVGDDQYGEDPSVNRLQERIAELLGKEAALFVPSGTMANQIGLKILTRPGDEVIVGDEAHIVWHESGRRGGEFRRAVYRRRPWRIIHRGRFAGRLQAARAISCSRRRRWWRSRTPITAAAVSCSRRPRRSRFARPRESSASRVISTARGCSTPRQRPAAASPSWRRHSISFQSRCRKGSAARSVA